jgi:hypothetical protein
MTKVVRFFRILESDISAYDKKNHLYNNVLSNLDFM